MHSRFLRFSALLVPVLSAAPALAQCVSLPNATPGTNLNLTDDSGRTVRLPFAFPFNGQNYNEISICSNGFLWLGQPPATGQWDFSDSEAEFLSQPPRIAPCWDDLNPANAPAGGGVFFRADGNSVSIAWKNVPLFASATTLVNFEVVLTPAGLIVLNFDPTTSAPTSTSITGITAGNNAAPAQVVWTATPTIANATGYELNPANTFPLVGQAVMLTPISANGYATALLPSGALPTCSGNGIPLASAVPYGHGCPSPTTGTFYELFPGSTVDLSNTSIQFTATGGNTYLAIPGPGLDTSYTPADALTQGDDSQVTVSTTAMGGFPYLGAPVTSIAAVSNGYLWMTPNASNDYSASASEFATLSPRIAPLWGDWTFASSGTFYWTATSTFCMATWENVPAFGQAGTQNTFQVKLFPNGDVVFSYGTVLNNSTTNTGIALAGLSGGNSAMATGSQDLSGIATVPAILDLTPSSSTATPLTHSATSLPQLGGTYSLEVGNIPSGTSIGVFVLSLTPLSPGVDLTPIGMPGCVQYVTVDVPVLKLITGTTMTHSAPIPNVAAFGGAVLASQGVTFSPLNALGVIASNGVRGTVGL